MEGEGDKSEKCVSSQKHTSLITKIQVYMFFSSNKVVGFPKKIPDLVYKGL